MSAESDNDSVDGHGRTSRYSSPVDELSSRSEPFPKRRRKRRSTVDRISELTDSLLVHILSFLPIEDAIKTQILSKRWKYLCTYLPSLDFRSYRSDYVERDVGEFADFVDKTLILCKCSKLKKFGVHFGYSEYEHRIDSKVNTWIRFAAGKGSEVLHLHLHSAEVHRFEDCRYELPQHLYSNSALRELHFSLCRVTPKRGVDWNSLKELSIGHVILSDEVIQKILVGTPVLEILELYYFHGVSHLHFRNASLKKLILREHWDRNNNFDGSELEISAPNLQSLEMLGCFFSG